MAGCFELACFYVVIRESDVPRIGETLAIKSGEDESDFNTFKLILHLCERHDQDLNYLIDDKELEIAKRKRLEIKGEEIKDNSRFL